MTGIDLTKKSNGEIVTKLTFPPIPNKKGLSYYIDGGIAGPKLSGITIELWQCAGPDTVDKRTAWFDQFHYFDAVEEWLKAGMEFHYLRCTILTSDELLFRCDLTYPSLSWKAWEPDPDNSTKAVVSFKKDQGV